MSDFSRPIRSIGDLASRNMDEQARDDRNCEQFIDGIYDEEIQELLLREEFESFCQAVTRAQYLEWRKRLPEREAGDGQTVFESWMAHPNSCLDQSAMLEI